MHFVITIVVQALLLGSCPYGVYYNTCDLCYDGCTQYLDGRYNCRECRPGRWGTWCQYSCIPCSECKYLECEDLCTERNNTAACANSECPDRCTIGFYGPRKRDAWPRCQYGHYQYVHNGIQICEECPTGSSSCRLDTFHSNTIQAISCDTGYYLHEQDGLTRCNRCPDVCHSCRLDTFNNNIVQCTSCLDGYYLDVSTKIGMIGCSVCPQDCVECNLNAQHNNTLQCAISCDSGVYFETNHTKGMIGCSKCPPWSEECKLNTFQNNKIRCIGPEIGYYLNASNQDQMVECSKCPDHCISCKLETIHSKTTIICTSCLKGYYLYTPQQETVDDRGIGQRCDKCQVPCETCIINTYFHVVLPECTSCVPGYYFNYEKEKSDKCTECPNGCRACGLVDVNAKKPNCTRCEDGFSFQNKDGMGVCVNDPPILSIMVTVSIVAFVVDGFKARVVLRLIRRIVAKEEQIINRKSINFDGSKLKEDFKAIKPWKWAKAGDLYTILVKTGPRKNAVTDANVYITFYGKEKPHYKTEPISPKKKCTGDKLYMFSTNIPFEVTCVEVGHDNTGQTPDWFCDHVTILSDNTQQVFTCKKWLSKSKGDGMIKRVLYENKVINKEELHAMCRLHGRTSQEVADACKRIRLEILACSVTFREVWPTYKPAAPDDIVFVVFRKPGSDISVKLSPSLNSFAIVYRNIGEYCNEDKEIPRGNQFFSESEKIDRKNITDILQKTSGDLMKNHSNLNIISASPVKSKGFRLQKQLLKQKPCILFYVCLKGYVPLQEEELPSRIGSYKTDIREGAFTLYGDPEPYSQQLKIGCSIGEDSKNVLFGGAGGTLGAFVNLGGKKVGCITSAHVLLDQMKLFGCKNSKTDLLDTNAASSIYQPAPSLVPTADKQPFGRVTSVVYKTGGNGVTGVEAGVVTITDPNRFPDGGQYPKIAEGFNEANQLNYRSGKIFNTIPETIGQFSFYKYGAVTGLTRGVFRLEAGAVRTSTLNVRDQCELHQQIEVCSVDTKPFAEPGDSGSLVLIALGNDITDLHAIGILTGGTVDRFYVTPIWDVLNALDLPLQLKNFDEHLHMETDDNGHRIDSVSSEIEVMKINIEEVKTSFDKEIKTLYQTVETKVGNMETKVGNMDTKVGNIEIKVGHVDTNVGHVERKAGNIETKSLSGSVNNSSSKSSGDIKDIETSLPSIQNSDETEYVSRFTSEFEHIRIQGGFGVVFEVMNKVDECHYAVKRIAFSNRDVATEKVKREARALAKLDHVGIVRYYNSWIESPPTGWQEDKDREIGIEQSECISSPIPLYSTTNNKSSPESSKNSLGSSPPKVINIPTQKKASPFDFLQNMYGGVNLDNLEGSHSDGDLINLGEWSQSGRVGQDDDEQDGDSGLLSCAVGTSDISSLHNDSSIEFKLSNSVGELSEYSNSQNVNKNNCDNNSIKDVPFNNYKCSDRSLLSKCDSTNDVDYTGKLMGTSKLTNENEKQTQSDMNKKSVEDAVKVKRSSSSGPKHYLYIQMQICKPESLKDWLSSNTRNRDRHTVIFFFEQIVHAIEYVHGCGLIHRDLKPSNLFFSLDGVVKIGDFGLVTALPEEQNEDYDGVGNHHKHSSQVGTTLYMSPEQMSGKEYSEKVDIFSLGVILFELLYPFATQMERVKTLEGVKQQIFPDKCTREMTEECNLIRLLLSMDPDARPTACKTREMVMSMKEELKGVVD